MPAMRLRLRTLMLLVALAAVLMGAERTRRRWRHFREQAAFHASEEAQASSIVSNLTASAATLRKIAGNALAAGQEKQARDWNEIAETNERTVEWH